MPTGSVACITSIVSFENPVKGISPHAVRLGREPATEARREAGAPATLFIVDLTSFCYFPTRYFQLLTSYRSDGLSRRGRVTMNAAVGDLVRGWERNDLWLMLAWDDLRLRYKRSVLGPFWITLGTGFFISVLSIFRAVVRDRADDVANDLRCRFIRLASTRLILRRIVRYRPLA